MLVDLRVKWFAERDGVRVGVGGDQSGFGVVSETEMKFTEEVKSRPIHQPAAPGLIPCSEKDGGRKDTLEALHHTPVIPTVLGEAEEVEHLGSAVEMDGAVLLPEGERCNSNRNKAVLTEAQTEVGMPNDMKEETSIAALVEELMLGEAGE